MEPTGRGECRVLIVGEAPGATEDEEGRQFIGESGQILRDTIKSLGFMPNRDCWITNAIICRPPNNVIPHKNVIDWCRPNLLNTIKEKMPQVIILCGSTAVSSLLGHLWKDEVGTISRWVGWQIPNMKLNAWICPTFHPSFLLRTKDDMLTKMFKQHLKKAFALEGCPFIKPPNYKERIKVLIGKEDEVCETLEKFMGKGHPIAFDYETNMLKPDSDKARIVSCSVSNGTETIAYPWHGKKVINTTRAILRSPVPKIAANMKFEQRWTRAKLKCNVRNWDFDTMIAAHVLDHRPDITSLKFLAFAVLGQGDYDSHIAPYLKGKGGNFENRIKEVDLPNLLLYNGMDALLEFHLARVQKEQL